MKKLLFMLMVLFTTLNVNAKCNWSGLKLQQWNERNYYKWYVSGAGLGDDSCIDWMFMVYDFQTKKIDTVDDYRGICEVQFNKKGKYKMYLKVWNKCTKCDTALYREVNIIQFPGASIGYHSMTQNCKEYLFELSYIKGYTSKDTCMEYYLMFYKGPWMDTMSQKEWDGLTDYQIGMEYDFPDDDFLGYTQTRITNFTFKDTGRVLMIAQWWDGCLKQDTFMFRKLDICKRTNTSEIKEVTKIESMVVPNPADGGFTIQIHGVTNYELIDMNGRKVLSGEYKEGDVISTTDLREGLYYIKTNRSIQPLVIKH